MAFSAKLLAEGQLASSKGTIYTVPGVTQAYVKTIKLHNTVAATQTISLYLNGSGTSRKTYQIQLAQDESAVVDDNITLEAADLIQGETSNASAVDYTIHGVEET